MRNVLTIAVAVATAAPAAAHHSDAGLDTQSLVTLVGTVVEYNWRNPHVYIVVDSLDEQGRTVRWSLQTSSTLTLARSGWTCDSLMPGEGVTFSAHPALDGRPHPDIDQRFQTGHSIGTLEDNVLIVDTRNFEDHRSPYQTGVPSGAQKHVVERYELSEDGTHILLEFMLEDPEYFVAPMTHSRELFHVPDHEPSRFDCDIESTRRFVPE